jgi:hypothetical protein
MKELLHLKTNIYIPKKIKVGYRERNDTYTKKLAYVVCFDERGKLRKEASWEGWRDKKIEPHEFENEPTSGFVLNKKIGGYSSGWNHRQTYVRVYDPRGFEFEINVTNLLYILENANSIKGKGLEGEFVYGWEGKDLILIPTESPDYVELTKYNEIVHNNEFIKAKELKIGGTYLSKDNTEHIYMGKFDEYNYDGTLKKGKSFYFAYPNKYSQEEGKYSFTTMKTMTKKYISCVSEECVENYANIFDQLECEYKYSPIDYTKDEYVYYTKEEVFNMLNGKINAWRNYANVYTDLNNVNTLAYRYSSHIPTKGRTRIEYHNNKFLYKKRELVEREYGYSWNKTTRKEEEDVKYEASNLEDLMVIVKPMWRKVYLKNGKLYKEDKE